jgi:hypothetical protein
MAALAIAGQREHPEFILAGLNRKRRTVRKKVQKTHKIFGCGFQSNIRGKPSIKGLRCNNLQALV